MTKYQWAVIINATLANIIALISLIHSNKKK